MSQSPRERTIDDFSDQWTSYDTNDGYYGSPALFADVFGPLLDVRSLEGARVAEVGAGTGRFIRVLLDAGASAVVAVEPSAAYEVLTARIADSRLECWRLRGDQIPPLGDLDYIFAIGVLHHIPDPDPVVRAMFNALKPGGKIAVWLYGAEGNEMYLAIGRPFRAVTTRLPHVVLAALVRLMYWPVVGWMTVSRFISVPLSSYMRNVFSKLTPTHRRLVLYDQLNPTYAKYYTRLEVHDLLARAGFSDLQLHHRHGYSWAAVGTKPITHHDRCRPG